MRIEKVSILNEVIDRVKSSDFCFVLNYGGLKVTQLTTLRKELAAQKSRAMVVKNTYLAKAAKDLAWDDISTMLSGPTAIVTGTGDVAEVAKMLTEFVKKNNIASVKGASLEKALLSGADVEAAFEGCNAEHAARNSPGTCHQLCACAECTAAERALRTEGIRRQEERICGIISVVKAVRHGMPASVGSSAHERAIPL
jgi:large subunit ribosomal protein L10